MDKCKLTRVVTSYGQWGYIRRWIFDDRLLQSHVTWIFVNDKPDDIAPPDIRQRISSMGLLIEPKANMGRCCARNLGVFNSTSEWIDIVDGDDIPFSVEDQFDRGHEFAGLIYFNVVHHRVDEDGRIVKEQTVDWQPDPLCLLFKEVVGNWDVRPAATLWRRKVICDLGGYDRQFDYFEDFNLAIRAKIAGVKHSSTSAIKVSYRRDTPGRPNSPSCALAGLKNWELARSLAPEGSREAVEKQIRFYRWALLWAGMREVNKSKPSLFRKLREAVKWIAGLGQR